MSILSFFVANVFLLYDQEPHVDDLGKDDVGCQLRLHTISICRVHVWMNSMGLLSMLRISGLSS